MKMDLMKGKLAIKVSFSGKTASLILVMIMIMISANKILRLNEILCGTKLLNKKLVQS